MIQANIQLPLGVWVEKFVDWLNLHFAGLFDFIKDVFVTFYDAVNFATSAPPFWVILIILSAIAWLAKGIRLAAGTALGLLVIQLMDLWKLSMNTLALTIVSAVIALLIAIPLGILAAKYDMASKIIRPILDFLQTMPAFVYLIPAILFFRAGIVPGAVATILFALAPGVRLTELGIRNVDKEVVEAGYAFGASNGTILRQIQLPLAMPSIMAGINQVIMLSLSMVVIAGMVGAGGLGGAVVGALQRIKIGAGFEAGLAVVIIAMILDRITASLGKNNANKYSSE